MIIERISSFIWGFPMIILLAGTHIFTTFHLKGIQFHIFRQFKACLVRKNSDKGEVTQITSLMTLLASTMGTGNIIGVSTALISGGPGSIFWMVAAGFFGMATKYAETWIAVKHRERQIDGTYLGGAMVILKDKHPFVSLFFSIVTALCALGIGCSVQSNAAALMLNSTFQFPLILIGVIFSVLTFLVIIGGIKKISYLCNILVPIAGVLYLSFCILLLWINQDYLYPAFQLILSSAFSFSSFQGGIFGISVSNAIRYGVSRGLFTNESGMGSTPILSAASECSTPETPAYVAMFSVLIDTVLICSITGIVFVSCMIRFPSLQFLQQADLLALSCFSIIPYGNKILTISITLFALSTIFGWCLVGERALQFLFGPSVLFPYRLLWIFSVFLGCVFDMKFLWSFSDIVNASMCLPNLLLLYRHIHDIQP